MYRLDIMCLAPHAAIERHTIYSENIYRMGNCTIHRGNIFLMENCTIHSE